MSDPLESASPNGLGEIFGRALARLRSAPGKAAAIGVALTLVVLPLVPGDLPGDLWHVLGGSRLPASWEDESLRIEGDITIDSYETLSVEFDAAPERYKRVILDSRGGELFVAIHLAAMIRENGLDTYVGNRGECLSACTLVFQAGVARIAHPTATFAYHCVIVQVPGSDRCYTNAAFTRLYKDALAYYGAATALLDRIVPDETIRLSAREALEFGVVTEVDGRR